MQSKTTCPLVEQYLGYLVVIKDRSDNTVIITVSLQELFKIL
ncbi:hypothetical protein VT96_0229210 [Clostridium sporogenes]|nr:integrase family protein [Clostridium botulinum Prevot_594]KRU44070.1 hypothetical protein VT94_12450 [Clostridium sporogenes]OQP94700.1 hypothetical protein VT96_0229210 [Clostridium sporogenes]OQP94875.1 hypothetical protein VT93_0206140 [Clostridium sporogenes]SQB31260.1 integrase family protein [Clostridium sporogenes]